MRWNGSDWSSLATPNGIVNALAADGRGQLAVGGVFSAIDAGTAGDVITAFAARYGTTCPAVAAPFGVGCAGRTLTAAALPWVDATFRADGSGLPDPAVVVALSSFTSVPQGVLPLATVFAAGQPGCDVLVEPDILQALLPNGGAVQSSLYLPPVPPLVGLSFFHQMIAFEVDAVGFVGITATNGLELLVGDL